VPQVRWGVAALAPAQQGPGAGLQFSQVEGLGEVVVGAQVQALDPVLDAVPGGEDEHGGQVARRPVPAQHLQAIQPGQAQVQDDQVEAAGPQQGQGRLPVPRVVGGIAGGAHGAGQAVLEDGVVFDDEYSHAGFRLIAVRVA
jgi:hypothetical protein